MPDIFVNNNFYQGTSAACVIDLTPPTFAGVNFLDVESRGQIRAAWAAGSDANLPIRYEVYIQATTSVGLFNTANIVAITPNLQFDIYNMPNGSFLVNGTTYHVGVRAIDALSNRDANLVSMSVISTGILTSIDVYEAKASWSVDDLNQFRITMWANKNESLAKSPSAILGTASYQVFDKLGAPIVGMSGSGIAANSEGLYTAIAVSSLLDEDSEHYEIRVTVSVDGEDRTNFIRLEAEHDQFEVNGTGGIDDANDLIGSFWVTNNEKVVTANLGLGSYQVYEADGTPILGFSESGIVADVNGFFSVTPIPLPPSLSSTEPYIVRYTIIVHGEARSHNVIFTPGTTTYTCRSTFSINAANQLEATFWSTINDQLTDPALLGTASYQVYDKLGNAVVGLSQSGIVADVNGFFHTTPVSAALLSDLTHYTVKLTINIAGSNRVVAKGFSLLGN
jgi:hypothetical protein